MDAADDFIPPFKSDYTTDNKGRGIFATRYIQKGEMTYGGKKNYAFFSSGDEYRRFINELTNEEACDIMMWTWPQRNMGRDGETLIVLILDDNSLQNHANGIKEDDDDSPSSSDDDDNETIKIDMISMTKLNQKMEEDKWPILAAQCTWNVVCSMSMHWIIYNRVRSWYVIMISSLTRSCGLSLVYN